MPTFPSQPKADLIAISRHTDQKDAANMNYEEIGKFIYGACRSGAAPMDIENWMADDLGIARIPSSDNDAAARLMTAFFAKYDDSEKLQANYDRFVAELNNRPS